MYELEQTAVKCMRGILFCYMKQSTKVCQREGEGGTGEGERGGRGERREGKKREGERGKDGGRGREGRPRGRDVLCLCG